MCPPLRMYTSWSAANALVPRDGRMFSHVLAGAGVLARRVNMMRWRAWSQGCSEVLDAVQGRERVAAPQCTDGPAAPCVVWPVGGRGGGRLHLLLA